MAYFIRLVRFTPEGLKEIKQFRARRAEFLEQAKKLRISIVAEFVTSGSYNLVTILEAPNLDVILQFSAITWSKGRTTIETLGAVRAEDFERIVDSI